MTVLQRMPEDKEILDMIRAGVNTAPDIAHKIYGYPESWEWQLAKNRVVHRLHNLKRFNIIRQTGRWSELGNGVKAKIWEVVE